MILYKATFILFTTCLARPRPPKRAGPAARSARLALPEPRGAAFLGNKPGCWAFYSPQDARFIQVPSSAIPISREVILSMKTLTTFTVIVAVTALLSPTSVKSILVEREIHQTVPIVDFYVEQPQHRETQHARHFRAQRITEMGQVEGDQVFAVLFEV
jgi:hypothetical protein